MNCVRPRPRSSTMTLDNLKRPRPGFWKHAALGGDERPYRRTAAGQIPMRPIQSLNSSLSEANIGSS